MEDQGAVERLALLQAASLRLFSAMALGYVHQWVMMGPKNVPQWFAWVALAVASVLLYWWSEPEAINQFQANWRFAIVGIVSFCLAARGTGSATARFKVAPKADSL